MGPISCMDFTSFFFPLLSLGPSSCSPGASGSSQSLLRAVPLCQPLRSPSAGWRELQPGLPKQTLHPTYVLGILAREGGGLCSWQDKQSRF